MNYYQPDEHQSRLEAAESAFRVSPTPALASSIKRLKGAICRANRKQDKAEAKYCDLIRTMIDEAKRSETSAREQVARFNGKRCATIRASAEDQAIRASIVHAALVWFLTACPGKTIPVIK